MKKILFISLALLICLAVFSQEMVLVPGGEFLMGRDSKNWAADSPAHRVQVDSFYMDVHEVTNLEYKAFCEATGTSLPEFWNVETFRCGDAFPEHPVVGVNYFAAIKYAAWAGKRLPTEAEWEYAARGGLKGKNYPNGDKWQREKLRQEPGLWENLIMPVRSFVANGYGLYDMADNVWEWVADRYSEDYYSQSPVDNPEGPSVGVNRVIRGGSWHSGAMCKTVYHRKGLISNWCDYAVGFRCVKDL